jgi:hypothetical protein
VFPPEQDTTEAYLAISVSYYFFNDGYGAAGSFGDALRPHVLHKVLRYLRGKVREIFENNLHRPGVPRYFWGPFHVIQALTRQPSVLRIVNFR